MRLNKIKIFSASRTIIFGFAGLILVGTFLLMLPISSVNGESTPFLNCLFTATSSSCVTGLVLYDTATHWSFFGQLVIMLMIQIGGMGIVTMAIIVTLLSGKKISLLQRSTMQESISAHNVGGIVKFSSFIIISALIIELLGAISLSFVFCRDFGFWRGAWMSIFHSVSAFCNAGFDLMGTNEKFSSLTSYVDNPLINIVVMLLIIIGGIGFMTWDDLKKNGFHFKRYRMQTKVILCVTAILIIVPAIYFFVFEFNDYPIKKRLLASLFQSVTPRTAGFNTVTTDELSETGNVIVAILMLIGGAPGSTAGGMKVTTIAVLFAAAASVFRKRDSARLFRRRIADDAFRSAATVLILYISLFLIGSMVISRLENIPILNCLYETASAIGTVGLTTGITPFLGDISKIILIVLMYMGRVGGLTIVFAAISNTPKNVAKLPQEKIMIG